MVIFTTRGCSFPVPMETLLVLGLVKEHLCVSLWSCYCFLGAGFSCFCSVGLQGKHTLFWCGTADNSIKQHSLDSPDCKLEKLIHQLQEMLILLQLCSVIDRSCRYKYKKNVLVWLSCSLGAELEFRGELDAEERLHWTCQIGGDYSWDTGRKITSPLGRQRGEESNPRLG